MAEWLVAGACDGGGDGGGGDGGGDGDGDGVAAAVACAAASAGLAFVVEDIAAGVSFRCCSFDPSCPYPQPYSHSSRFFGTIIVTGVRWVFARGHGWFGSIQFNPEAAGAGCPKNRRTVHDCSIRFLGVEKQRRQAVQCRRALTAEAATTCWVPATRPGTAVTARRLQPAHTRGQRMCLRNRQD